MESAGIPIRSTGYEHTVGQREKWTLKPDGSLGMVGLELVSPIMNATDGLEQIRKVAEVLATVAKVDDRCGIHVHHEVGRTPDRIA